MSTCDQALAHQITESIRARNPISTSFFSREAERLAEACRHMSERFLRGGRLLAFGRGACATDAQHVSVEFVHPVIIGKRALPALDLSLAADPWLQVILQPEDIVMGFSPPEGDPQVETLLVQAREKGALTFALSGRGADYSVAAPSSDPFSHQEMIEVLYHTLWETVHVFFEHRELGYDVGTAGFLYPFLGKDRQQTQTLVGEVASSILAKAREDERLREEVAREASGLIAESAAAIGDRLKRGGKLITFGNGGSATDATDLALDCVMPPAGFHPVRAISLSLEPANLTAIANDIGAEAIFLRQLIAHGRPEDVAIAISTSGNSANIVAALREARKRNLLTVALLGYDGGEIAREGLVDFTIVVRCDYIPRIQEVQASIYHVLREAIEKVIHG